MTIAEIEKRARSILLDTEEPYRWTSDDIRDEILDAVRHLQMIRPETRYIDGLLVDFSLPDDKDEDIKIDNRFRESLVYYVVYKCYLYDDSDTINAQLAENYLQKSNTYSQL